MSFRFNRSGFWDCEKSTHLHIFKSCINTHAVLVIEQRSDVSENALLGALAYLLHTITMT